MGMTGAEAVRQIEAARRPAAAAAGRVRERLRTDVAAACRAFARRVRLTGAGYLARLLREGPMVFEGAQGVLLDEWHGFHPYTTWSTTTFRNAAALLAEAGVTATRIGAAW